MVYQNWWKDWKNTKHRTWLSNKSSSFCIKSQMDWCLKRETEVAVCVSDIKTSCTPHYNRYLIIPDYYFMTLLYHPWWSHDSHVTWTWACCHWSSSMILTSSWQFCSKSLLLSPSLLPLPSNESSSCWRLVVPAEAREVGELEPSRVDMEALPSSPPVRVIPTLYA